MSLYKSKAKFICVSVDQALISNEKNVKNLKLSDFLCRRVSITLKNIKTDFPFLSKNHVFTGAFGNHIFSENCVL